MKEHSVKRSLSGLLLICLLIPLALVAQQSAPAQSSEKKQYTVARMYSPAVMASTAPMALQWSPDGSKLAFLKRGAPGQKDALYYLDPATGKEAVLVSAEKIADLTAPSSNGMTDDRARDNRARYGVAAYQWAPDSKGILFNRNGNLWYFNLNTNTGKLITRANDVRGDPQFSPNGEYLGYIHEHNLYIHSTKSDKQEQLTKGTDPNILNGEVDWVYSEELEVRRNYFWSPDSKQILYLQMNETQVPNYPIVDWVPQTPTLSWEKYPNPGAPNPAVRLAVTDLKGKTRWINLTSDTDIYMPRFGWLRPGVAWAMVMNREQNQEDLYFIDTNTGATKLVLTETNGRYIELNDGLHFFKDSARFLWPSWRDGHTHLYLYSYDSSNPLNSDAKLVNQVDKGDYEMNSLRGVDEKEGVVYFTANKDDPRQEQFYSIKLDGSDMQQLTKEEGVHHVDMASTTRYYMDDYSALTVQPGMQLCQTSGMCHAIWHSTTFDGYDTITPKFVNFKADDGTVMYGVIILPRQGAPAEVNGKFPLILNPYGGPHGQVVRDAYGTINAFDQILAHEGFAVLKVDNRGMWNRGDKFAFATFHNNLVLELHDQITALDQALAEFPQLDRTRLGWWGWSYGGSMTVWAMTHSTLFKAGVAVAPVTNWLNYDSIYTERYMGLPKDNPEGYKRTSIVNAAGNLSGDLLLVHGTSDDNVHMQNSIQFINAMINAGKHFEVMVYPRKTHDISGRDARVDLFDKILGHFVGDFVPPSAAK